MFGSVTMRLLVAAIFIVASLPVLAQEYDSKPFIKSLVDLKSTAMTCDPFVAGAPGSQMEGVDTFFSALGQNVPNVVDAETQKSLARFIKQQAAALCRDMLNGAFEVYFEQVAGYEENKGEGWPDTPIVVNGKWCVADDCSDFR